jgi:5-(carboxyamino)imidazole ribonucleotide synthase
MVGAGQLAQMTHQAAISLGIELRVLAAAADDPAPAAGAQALVGSAEQLGDLLALAESCDVVTFDHERVPPAHLAALEELGVRLAPNAAAKLLAQDKHHARTVLAERGFPLPPFAHARSTPQIEAFAVEHGWPLVLKAPRGGYDGRGVRVIGEASEAARALAAMGGEAVVEPLLELSCELAVIVARSTGGESAAYPVVETVQRDAMCREIAAPARVAPQIADQATELALEIAEEFDATGVVAVELFLSADGLLVNELALRPHNSGHYTIEGATTSQFEQHLRAVLGWPLGDTSRSAAAVATVNVGGPSDGSDPRDRRAAALEVPRAHVHLYGKAPRPGRKLGHVTVCADDREQALTAARRAARLLEGEVCP